MSPEEKRAYRVEQKAREKAQRRGRVVKAMPPSRRAFRRIDKGRTGHCLTELVTRKNLAHMENERTRKAANAFR